MHAGGRRTLFSGCSQVLLCQVNYVKGHPNTQYGPASRHVDATGEEQQARTSNLEKDGQQLLKLTVLPEKVVVQVQSIKELGLYLST